MDADEVYTVLVQECGAEDDRVPRAAFCRHWPGCVEYRFVGELGFGGKVWFNSAEEPGKRIYVTCYREDETVERQAMIARANQRLAKIEA